MDIQIEDYKDMLKKANKMESKNRFEAVQILYELIDLIEEDPGKFDQIYPGRSKDKPILLSRVKRIKRRMSNGEKKKVEDLEDKIREKQEEQKPSFDYEKFLKDIKNKREEAFVSLENGALAKTFNKFNTILEDIDEAETKISEI